MLNTEQKLNQSNIEIGWAWCKVFQPLVKYVHISLFLLLNEQTGSTLLSSSNLFLNSPFLSPSAPPQQQADSLSLTKNDDL